MNNKTIITFLVTAILLGGVFLLYNSGKSTAGAPETPVIEKTEETTEIYMKILSPAFQNNQTIPTIYTCDGENFNPPLVFQQIPEGIQSLVLIVDDPDAPTGTWTHWIIFNISPNTAKINENSVPEGALQGKNDFGNTEYGGPCPPVGAHRYFFKLFALDTTINLKEGAIRKDIEKEMENHILAEEQLVGTYQSESYR